MATHAYWKSQNGQGKVLVAIRTISICYGLVLFFQLCPIGFGQLKNIDMYRDGETGQVSIGLRLSKMP
jgi:hypothetical protein